MYSERPNLIIGFHGCDESVRDNVVNGKHPLAKSENDYDWLGHGFYFWEYNYKRALQFAKDKHKRGEINKPAVLGAIISLNHCLDLLDSEAIDNVKIGYDILKETLYKNNLKLPQNKKLKKGNDFIFRDLDCLVIETLHKHRKEKEMKPYDSVKGVFWEGDKIYPNAGFRKKNHIQICIRNLDCIKGYFIPIAEK